MRKSTTWLLLAACALCAPTLAQDDKLEAMKKAMEAAKGKKSKPTEFRPYKDVIKGYEKVISTANGKSLYTIWVDKKNGQMLAELPANYAKQKYFFAMTVSSGERFAGLQSGDLYVYWKRYGKRLALIEPQLATRATGEQEAKDSVKRIFTDRVVLDVAILTMGPKGGPVIDMDDLLVGKASAFFRGAARGVKSTLASIVQAKAFPHNVEVAYEAPVTGGALKTFHYSISSIPDKTGYKPRKADTRVGYFTTHYKDLGKYRDDSTWTRYINRWHVEKADPKLKLSPPKNPIVFYVEHTTPIRYRRFVRDGILCWNKAFEKIGIIDAIECYYQDARTGAHMDKDPEDVRYNFVRWLNNDVGTAIGPSRTHPLTGQILDADIILTDGWIRTFDFQFANMLPELAMQGFGAETLSWLAEHPDWDPRALLANPNERAEVMAELARNAEKPFGGHAMGNVSTHLMGDDEFDGLADRNSQHSGSCLASHGKMFDLALLRMSFELLTEDAKKADANEDVLDGMPARFIGPLLADLVAHEAGHTLGLRHNFRASSVYSLAEINSKEFAGKKPFTTSVMDYNPLNINMSKDGVQGDFAMIDIGPYDMWAIEYGYSFAADLKPILARCSHPEHTYGTDENTSGPDPFARRYDFTRNPADFARSQMELAKHHRAQILEKFVAKGQSWARARRGYDITLSLQTKGLSMMANWVGGTFVHRHKKGDSATPPIEPVSAAAQRDALAFCIENAFHDDAFGLTPELLRHMTVDKWWGSGNPLAVMQDSTYQLHDRVMGIQSSVLTMLMNPTTLRRVLDNERRVDAGADALTLPEMLRTVTEDVWSELAEGSNGNYTTRNTMVSSLRRNLQRVHVERLVDLATQKGSNAGAKTISSVARLHLRDIRNRVRSASESKSKSLDDYTRAHFEDCTARIQKALDLQYTRTVK